MKNPYAHLRERTGLSQVKFAEKHHMARQTLIAIEQGVYPTLSDRMIVELGKECHAAGVNATAELREAYGAPTLSEAYANWRLADRLEESATVNDLVPDQWTSQLSPMHFIVKGFGRGVQGFSKAMKIPTATLLRYLKGEQREMPTSVEEAFRGIGYPYLSELIARQAAWVDENKAA